MALHTDIGKSRDSLGMRPLCMAKAMGFTFIELMVVMSIIAMLLSIALPRYFDGLKRAREAILREDLKVMRDAIDHYYQDKTQYPASLEELVHQRYLRAIPPDPITDRADTWQIMPPPDFSMRVYNLHSASMEVASDGTVYNTW